MRKKRAKRPIRKSQAEKARTKDSRERPNKRNYVVLKVDGEDFALTKAEAAKFLQEVVNELDGEEVDAFISYFGRHE